MVDDNGGALDPRRAEDELMIPESLEALH
jgi:hypothetical protein